MTGATALLLRRSAATAYDLLILAGVLALTSFAVVVVRGGAAVPAGNVAFRLLLAAEIAAYFIGFWTASGQTPGLRTWHLRVEDQSGNPPAAAVAAKRFAAGLLAALPAGLGLAWMLLDREGLAWHDRLAGTRVVSRPPPGRR